MLFLANCTNPDLLRVIYFGKLALQVILIAMPIILIVMIIIDVAKGMMDGDQKNKNINMAIKRILMAVMLFLVPTIVNLCMHLLTVAGVEWTSCYDYANPTQIQEFTTIKENQKAASKALEEAKKAESLENSKSQNTSGVKYNPTNNNDGDSSSSTSNEKSSSKEFTIYVGDSRTVGMCNAKGITTSDTEDCTIAVVGKGYTWFAQTAIPSLKELLKSHPNSNVMIDLGTNDLYDPAKVDAKKIANDYAYKYNTLSKEYPKVKFIIVSINPVDNAAAKASEYKITNELVVEFNNALKSKLSTSVKYCDTYNQIKSSFTPSGGIHFTDNTYKQIYVYEQKCL